jgi:hypothetical protein
VYSNWLPREKYFYRKTGGWQRLETGSEFAEFGPAKISLQGTLQGASPLAHPIVYCGVTCNFDCWSRFSCSDRYC